MRTRSREIISGIITGIAISGGLLTGIALIPPSETIAQIVNPGTPTSGAPANNDCAKFVVVGGNVQSITTAGQGCVAGTPSAITGVNDTNVTITFGGTPLTALLQPVSATMGWTGTLGAGRLNANVVQGVTNDTNVTGSIAAQNLTLGWTGTLAIGRGGTGSGTQQGALNNIAPTPTRAGDIIYYNGTNWVALAGNNVGTVFLSENSTGVPSWSAGTGVTNITAGTGISLSSGANCTTTCTINVSGLSTNTPVFFGTGAASALAANTTGFIGFADMCSPTETACLVTIPIAGTVKNFYATASNASGAGQSYVFTLRKNGADQTVTCTMSNTTTCNDTTHSFAVAAGDTMTIKVVSSATAASLTLSSHGFQIVTTSP